jgi:archaellum component FlaC
MKKTKKKEKVIDLKPEVERISDEHLEQVQNLINVINKTQFELGSIEVKKHGMLHSLAGLNDEIKALQVAFEEVYKTSDINIQTGEINRKTHGGTN